MYLKQLTRSKERGKVCTQTNHLNSAFWMTALTVSTSLSKWMKIMTISTILAIFISCLGLFGLAGINALNRSKEVSIRKVLGASVSQLFYLLNKEVVVLALVSFLLASPIAYYIMREWLSSFTYRMEIDWILFIVALFIGLAIALITVGYQSLKTAFANPAKILKDE